MDKLFEFGLLAFASLFTMVNPLGVIPVYNAMTSPLTSAQAKKVAFKAVTVALLTMILFALTGKFIFDFFNISINGLRVVGGIIFFMAGYDMLQARLIRTKNDEETKQNFESDFAITPLAIPLLCGPGAITASIVLWADAETIGLKIFLLAAMALVIAITLIILLFSRKLIKILGESGNKVMMRIMGLIVMVIAIEFLFAGLKPIIRDILMIK